MVRLSPGPTIAPRSLCDDCFALDNSYLLCEPSHSRHSLRRSFHSHTQTVQLRQNDILQWLIDEKQDFTTRQLSPRILLTNLVAILSPTSVGSVHHPLTIMSLFQIDFTQALYHLAAYP